MARTSDKYIEHLLRRAGFGARPDELDFYNGASISDAVDATGAGDCFDGSFLARLAAGHDAVSAARWASAAAALTTTGYGAVAPLPTALDVARFMESASSHVGNVSG